MCHLTDNEQDFLPGCDLGGRPEGDSGDGGEEDVAEVGGQGLEGQEEQGEEVPGLQRRLLHDWDNVTNTVQYVLVYKFKIMASLSPHPLAILNRVYCILLIQKWAFCEVKEIVL